jgi:hypothetical protein
MKNSNYIIAIIVILSFVIITKAQQPYVGFSGGLNFADIDLKSESGRDQLTSSRTLWNFAGIFGFFLTENFSVETEPMYIIKGGTQMATSSSSNVRVKISVLEIPFFLKASVGNSLKPYLKAGPSIGFLLNSEAESEYGGVTAGQALRTYQGDMQNVLKGMDVSVTIGMGLSYSLNKYHIFVDGRYTLGLVDLYEGGKIEWKSGDDSFVVNGKEAAKLSTKAIRIVMGVIIPF